MERLEADSYLPAKETAIYSKIIYLLAGRDLNIVMRSNPNQTFDGRPLKKGSIAIILEDNSASPSEENLDFVIKLVNCAASYLQKLPFEQRLLHRDSLLDYYLRERIKAEFGLRKAIETFKNIPSQTSLDGLCNATARQASLYDDRSGTAKERETETPRPAYALSKSADKRSLDVLKEVYEADPNSPVAASIREIFAWSEIESLVEKYVTPFILSPLGRGQVSVEALFSELREKDSVLRPLVLSACGGYTVAQTEVIHILTQWEEMKGDLKSAQIIESRRVKEKLEEMRSFAVGKIHDCTASQDKATESMVKSYFEIFGRSAEERFFLLSAIKTPSKTLLPGFYQNLIAAAFGEEDDVKKLLEIYLDLRNWHRKVAPIKQFNQAVGEIAKAVAIGEGSKPYQEKLAADAVRQLYVLSDGETGYESLQFLINLLEIETIPGDLAFAIVWRLTQDKGLLRVENLEGTGLVKNVIDLSLSVGESRGAKISANHKAAMISCITQFLNSRRAQGFDFSESEKEYIMHKAGNSRV